MRFSRPHVVFSLSLSPPAQRSSSRSKPTCSRSLGRTTCSRCPTAVRNVPFFQQRKPHLVHPEGKQMNGTNLLTGGRRTLHSDRCPSVNRSRISITKEVCILKPAISRFQLEIPSARRRPALITLTRSLSLSRDSRRQPTPPPTHPPYPRQLSLC